MAQEYVLCENQNDLGIIALNKTVFETIAYISLDEFPEVRKHAVLKRCVVSKIVDNQLRLNIELKLVFGANLNNMSQRIQEKIYQNILDMTGFKCNNIDVEVIGFEF